MEQLVYVISKSGNPLMPTKRFGKVRRLLKEGKAKVVQRNPFTIQLLYDSTEYIQDLTLGIDPGSVYIGASVAKENGEPVYLAELETRSKDITKLMKNRATYRSLRRSHRRDKRKRRAKKCGTIFTEKQYKISGCNELLICKGIKPSSIRFQNRKNPEGYLVPTTRHLLDTHINFVKKINKILPIKNVIIEYCSFDMQKLQNPDIKGIEYQNGIKKGFTNNQAYVLYRDNHQCQLCKKRNVLLHGHHIIWRSEKGLDSHQNMVTLCSDCHDKVHKNKELDNKVKDKFGGIKRGLLVKTSLLNIIMPQFYTWLQNKFHNVEKTYGYITKDKRRELNLSKEHHIDAYLISSKDNQFKIGKELQHYRYKQFRRHNRANIEYQRERNYYLENKKVAVNRHKRVGQIVDSLEDLVIKNGEYITNLISVKPAIRAKRKKKNISLGDTIKYKNNFYTVKGSTNNYLCILGNDDIKPIMSKTNLVFKNTGMVPYCYLLRKEF